MHPTHRASYLPGFLTLLALAALTWLEFQIDGRLIGLLVLVGLAKAGLILQVFMHLSRLWSGDR